MHFCCFFETIDQQPQPVGAHVTALPASMHDSALKKTVNTVSAPLLPAGTAPPRALRDGELVMAVTPAGSLALA